MESDKMDKEKIFKQVYDANRTIDGIIKEMDTLRAEKLALKGIKKQKHHRKILREINRRINKLNILKAAVPVIRQINVLRDQYGLEIQSKAVDQRGSYNAPVYVYEGKERKPPNDNKQAKQEKMQACHSTPYGWERKKIKAEKKRKKEIKDAQRREKVKVRR